MMSFFSVFALFVLSFWSFPSFGQVLSCRKIHYIQERFLKHHVSHNKLTEDLKNQTLSKWIENLDREKIYFLKSDIDNIKKKNRHLFSDLRRKKCHGLYYVYDIYSKRMEERLKFANKYLKGKFLFQRNLKYVLEDDLKSYPSSVEAANQQMKAYIQYQVANIFLFEKDLKKSVQQVSYILNSFKKQMLSWKPRLNPREKRECRTKSKHSFKACKPTKWLSSYLNAYSQSLDSHSSYLDNEDLEEFYIAMNLKLEGIGATLSSRFGYTVVERLISGGAAVRSKKIKRKDKILAVGQSQNKLINIFGERIEDVVSIIRGPKGTPVFLKILREEKGGKNIISLVKLIRDRVDLKEEEASITYHNIKAGGRSYKVGLLQVPSFYGSNIVGKSVTRDVKRLLISARKQKIQSLVLDLSFNRGGSLDEAVDLSGLFFSTGNVVKQSEKNETRPQILRDNDERVFYSGPLVVLVNRLSASASEIVAGTLQDYNRAVIVGGDHTFGKGSVQSVEPLPRLGALKTTVGLYFIPSGKSTQKEGVKSDIIFPSIFNTEKLGEKSLDYVLPSKKISDFKSSEEEIFAKGKNNWRPIDSQIIAQLRKSSQKRMAVSKDFQKAKKRLKESKEKSKNRQSISIAEVLENKNAEDETKLEEGAELSQTDRDKKYLERLDIQEALNIAKELALLQEKSSANKKGLAELVLLSF